MQILANVAELWVFSRTVDGPRYLVLEASQEKADAFFGGHRFWQIPGTSMHDDGEATVDLLRRGLAEYGLEASALWAVEHAPDRIFGDVGSGVSAARFGTRALVGSALLRRLPIEADVAR